MASPGVGHSIQYHEELSKLGFRILQPQAKQVSNLPGVKQPEV